LGGQGGNATAPPAAVIVSRVLGCLTNLPPLRNCGGDNDVPPYDALRRLLLAKHGKGRALTHFLVAIVLPNLGIIVDLLKLVIFVNVPRCHRLLRYLLSFPPLPSSTSSAAAATARNHLRHCGLETLSDLLHVLESAQGDC
jgi:hypothetical protein